MRWYTTGIREGGSGGNDGDEKRKSKLFSNFRLLPLQRPVFGARIPPDQTPRRGTKNLFNKNAVEKNVSSHVCICAPAKSARIYVRAAVISPGSETMGSQSPSIVGDAKRKRFSSVLGEQFKNHIVDSYDHM